MENLSFEPKLYEIIAEYSFSGHVREHYQKGKSIMLFLSIMLLLLFFILFLYT